MHIETSTLDSKRTKLYIFLFGIFLTNAIVAEIVGAKIFSVEKTLGFAPIHLNTFFGIWDLNQTAGALNWPFVFITSDIINEYFGKKGVKRISYLTAGFIAYSFLIIYGATLLVPADFWLDVNKGDHNFNINEAFAKIFRQGLGIITGSLSAFLISQILDAYVFHSIRKVTKGEKIWLRATGSTLVSQLIDSFVVIGIAFVVFGNWTIDQWISTSLNNYLYKFFSAIIMTPLIYLAHNLIDGYLGKELSDQLISEAGQQE
ncbi:queuosine precursor transporter [Cellulophaga sp. BC115SP]|uniref:queuosine precursor transporter n=1 Tax=Cellulophaga sp. BC115SP TaxID=2683263 RepID=UPI001412FE2C|nr:queuosine precursor transporter [Cellulophaga sp. BC115SP]NBB31313.1 queuosine precursor transporter [Cellulophaga sp. BC115SP]